MRIALVTASLSSAGAGVKEAVENLSRALEDNGHDVRVFGVADKGWRAGDAEKWRGAEPVALHRCGPIAHAPEMTARLVDWMPQVVHRHGLWLYHSRSVLEWHLRTGRDYVVSPHGMLAPEALRLSPLKKKLAAKLYELPALRAAACYHATCKREAHELRVFGLDGPVATIPHGVDLPRTSELEGVKRNAVLYLGRLHPIKGLDRLLRAWSILEAEFPDWFLEVIGPSERGYAAELARLAVSIGCRRVTIEGPVYGGEKIKRLSSAAIFTLPTRSENFAITVAESLACGTPVITTNGAPWDGLVENRCGWWIEQDDRALSKALRQAMLLSTDDRIAMGNRGRVWMQREYSWRRVAEQMADVYAHLSIMPHRNLYEDRKQS